MSRTSAAARARSRPAAGSTTQCWPRSGHRARQPRPGSGGSPNPGSPAPAAQSAHGHQRRLRACRAADADTSTGARAATGANDESSPAARKDCPTAHGEVSGPVRPGTSDRLGGSLAGPPADGAPRARDAKRVARPRSRPLIGNATQPIRGGVETASRSMRWPPDDPANNRSNGPNRVSGTLRHLRDGRFDQTSISRLEETWQLVSLF